MLKFWKNFLKEEDGMGTVEIILIVAILIGLALLFKSQITSFVGGLMSKIFDTDGVAKKATDTTS